MRQKRREQKPTKKDLKYIICIFQINEQIYVEYKWKKAASSAIFTLEDSEKYGSKQQIDDYLKVNKIIKRNKMKSIDLEKLNDMPLFYCTIRNDCYQKFKSSSGRDEHEEYVHIKKIKKGMMRKAIKEHKKNKVTKNQD
jgi:hypothetical protein